MVSSGYVPDYDRDILRLLLMLYRQACHTWLEQLFPAQLNVILRSIDYPSQFYEIAYYSISMINRICEPGPNLWYVYM